jgi:hypothetical protein
MHPLIVAAPPRCVGHTLGRVAHQTNGTVEQVLAELDEKHAQVLWSILEGFCGLHLTGQLSSNMLRELAFVELIDAQHPSRRRALVQIIQDQLIALS